TVPGTVRTRPSFPGVSRVFTVPGMVKTHDVPDDHPDRFSFPWRFAYCSPRRKTQSPSGIDAAPITISGQMSPQTAAGPAPSMIAARIPRRAYVAGEIVEIACIHPGSTETG